MATDTVSGTRRTLPVERMIISLDRLRLLIDEYGELSRLENHTPQSRGQRFNGLIAETLQCYGIDARADVNATGNIDVIFNVEGYRFILEAKWESTPADTGHVSKLQKRVRQRLGGTIGVLLSMSGFSAQALRDVKDGERLEVLLLGKEHFEAMLSGFSPPDELLSRLLDRASYFGEATSSLMTTLAGGPLPELEEIQFGCPVELRDLIAYASPGFEADVVVANLPFRQSGVAELVSGALVVTLGPAIIVVDLAKGTVEPLLPIPDCSRSVIVTP